MLPDYQMLRRASPAILEDAILRLTVTLPYWWSGIDKFLDPESALAEFQAMGLPASWLLFTVLLIVQIGGSLAIVFNKSSRLGAFALIAFTATATLLGHAFWAVGSEQRSAELNNFLEHIALMAGLALVATRAPRPHTSINFV